MIPISVTEAIACIKDTLNNINIKSKNFKEMWALVGRFKNALRQISGQYGFPFENVVIMY